MYKRFGHLTILYILFRSLTENNQKEEPVWLERMTPKSGLPILRY